MKHWNLSALCLLLTLSVNLTLAADAPAGKKAKAAKKAPRTPAAFKLPKEVTLTAQQQQQFDDIKAQYASKLTEAQKKVADVYTDAQRAAQQAARKEATAAGKKGKELKAAVDASVQLTDEQKQKLTTAQSDLMQLSKEIRKQITGLLTKEQRQALRGKRNNK